ncbi:hypothetical protein AYO44_00615 [Planctomycetaceae bacterium SCGC AG-212-F19]|nr:hypothetical protein AYO44_00615 [Planctomycetaceae bacterium SCGC AG-212-F19]
MSELGQTLIQLVVVFGRLLFELAQLALSHSLLIAWVAWWLWGVNWAKLWPTLARGAWAPMALLVFMTALVWSKIAPGEYHLIGIVTVPNFFWQFGAVSLLAALTLVCGWLQGIFHWTPPEIRLEPAVVHHGHGSEPMHGHGPESGEPHAVEQHDTHGHH